MKISHITLTGVDNTTDLDKLLKLSKAFPHAEWGILFSRKNLHKEDAGRYKIDKIVKTLSEHLQNPSNTFKPRLAAHMCGDSMKDMLNAHVPAESKIEAESITNPLSPFGLDWAEFALLFDRVQMNFNAKRHKIDKNTFQTFLKNWVEHNDSALITQHNSANQEVWAWGLAIQEQWACLRPHQVLHDASGGQGKHQGAWNQPIAGIANGFAGGLGPDNVVETLKNNQDKIGHGSIWIDMEQSLRTENDRLDLDRCEAVLEAVTLAAQTEGWFL